MVSIKEYIQQNYENCQRMVLLRFGAKSNELIMLKCFFNDNYSETRQWSKKKLDKATSNLLDFLQYLEFHAFNFDLMYLLYIDSHPTYYQFMKSLNQEVPIELDTDETRVKFCVDTMISLNEIRFYLSQHWETTNELIYESLDYLKKQKWLNYEKGSFKNQLCIIVSDVKNPQINLIKKADLKERFEPISVSKGQDRIRDILYNNNIPFIQEYGITIDNKKYRFDFAVYGENGIKYFIEYDGEQHFKPVEQWGGEQGLKDRQASDAAKNNWAKEKGIPLIRIPYTEKNISLADVSLHYSRYIS